RRLTARRRPATSNTAPAPTARRRPSVVIGPAASRSGTTPTASGGVRASRFATRARRSARRACRRRVADDDLAVGRPLHAVGKAHVLGLARLEVERPTHHPALVADLLV